jgi:ABC-type proline/glycine betaine transport system ATPase subunit
MKGVGGSGLRKRIDMLLEGVNLIEAARLPIVTYSGGMKQRIGIAQALLNDPKVLIFDEPTVGLDPEERVRFRNLITGMANDCIIILSSHIVSDIETIADEVAIMKNGTLTAKGTQAEVIKAVEGKVFETVLDTAAADAFKTNYHVINSIRQKDKTRIRYISDQPSSGSSVCTASLEDAYLLLTKNNRGYEVWCKHYQSRLPAAHTQLCFPGNACHQFIHRLHFCTRTECGLHYGPRRKFYRCLQLRMDRLCNSDDDKCFSFADRLLPREQQYQKRY